MIWDPCKWAIPYLFIFIESGLYLLIRVNSRMTIKGKTWGLLQAFLCTCVPKIVQVTRVSWRMVNWFISALSNACSYVSGDDWSYGLSRHCLMYIYTCPLVTGHLVHLGIPRCLLPIGKDGFASRSMKLYSAARILLGNGVSRCHSFTRRNFSVAFPLLDKSSQLLHLLGFGLPWANLMGLLSFWAQNQVIIFRPAKCYKHLYVRTKYTSIM